MSLNAVICKLIFVIMCFLKTTCSKYMEGELRTSEKWAFLARFCFLSEQGQFEYHFEFKNDQGYPNLLLYYDAVDQWPAVYKTDKTCREKESVLHINNHQIINLTLQNHLEANCLYQNEEVMVRTTPKPWKPLTYPINLNGYKTKTLKPTTAKPPKSTETTVTTTRDPQFHFNESEEEQFDYNDTAFNDIDNLFGEYFNGSDPGESRSFIEKRSIRQKSPEVRKAGATIVCRNVKRFRSSRATWWFIAISNCDGSKGIHLKYQLLLTNGEPQDYWHEHFSADEFYVLPVLMAFSIAYGMLLFSIAMCSVELKSRQLLHSTYKLFVLSVVLQLCGIALTSMAYLKYAVTGMLPYRTKVFGGLFMGACETIFLLMLLLLAKGYTTTRGRLPISSSIKITIFMCLYVVTYLTLFIYEAKVFDPGDVLYLYESPAGYGLIVLRIVAWWMFIYSTIFTLKHYPEKSNFYYPFNICGTLWFVAGPAFIISANFYIDKWVRESVVCGVLLFITFAGHLMFLILTLPSMANKNFPYHIRTTQIGVMELTGASGVSTIDQFSHHVYQPTAIEQTVIIPLHGNTEDIFSRHKTLQLEEARKETTEHAAEDDSDVDEKKQNVNLENVLRWSTVKGCVSPLDFGLPDRMSSMRSHVNTAAMSSAPTSGTSPQTNFRSANNQHIDMDNSLNYWIRDVPVELFTISKMVINKPLTH